MLDFSLIKAKVSYEQGPPIELQTQLAMGTLPNPGQVLLTMSDSGLVGIIEIANKKLSGLKTAVQLKIREGGSIVWSESLKQYVAVGGNAYFVKSDNGIFWEYVENPSSMGLSKVIWNENLNHRSYALTKLL